MNDSLKTTLRDYIATTKWGALITVRDDGAPIPRVMGSFALVPGDTLDLYFSSDKAAAKVGQIASHPTVSFYFQHEGHTMADYKNVVLIGPARLTEGADRDQAIGLLKLKSPHFKEMAEANQLDGVAIFRLQTVEVKGLDYTRPVGPARVIAEAA